MSQIIPDSIIPLSVMPKYVMTGSRGPCFQFLVIKFLFRYIKFVLSDSVISKSAKRKRRNWVSEAAWVSEWVLEGSCDLRTKFTSLYSCRQHVSLCVLMQCFVPCSGFLKNVRGLKRAGCQNVWLKRFGLWNPTETFGNWNVWVMRLERLGRLGRFKRAPNVLGEGNSFLRHFASLAPSPWDTHSKK